MKVRNIVRKAAVIGAGATVAGVSIMGAFAYDLANYPQKFIADGVFDGKIVVGERAATPDVIGSIDIAASLQGASVSAVPIPGQAGQISFEGDAFKLGTSSDELELREQVGEVVETVTEEDLAGLRGGRITTAQGSTDYQQFIRLGGDAGLQEMAVNFITNQGEDDERMSDFLVVDNDNDAFLQWEVQFDQGFESELEDRSSGDVKDLDDYEDRTINIMGTDYSVVRAFVTNNAGTPEDLEMTLMGGSIADTLREGETRTYSIDGVDYEVTLVFVSDPNTGSTEAKFSVNGELTQAMEEGDTDTLSGGLQIGVRDVLVNAREGVASFFLGADKIVVTVADLDGTFNGNIEINEDIDENNVVAVEGSISGSDFEITSIKYQVTMDSAEGQGGVAYVPAGHGIREFMDEPELLISDSLNIMYGGLTMPDTAMVSFEPSGDDEYQLSFTNINGDVYSGVPLLSTDGASGALVFGDSDDDLVLVESEAGTGFNIGIDDIFVVSSKLAAEGDRAVTNVLQYEEYDGEKRTIEFTDLAGGTVSATLNTTGGGTFNVGGHTYDVQVDVGAASDGDDDDADIVVDLDGSGTITDGEMAIFTSWGGLFFELTDITDGTNNVTDEFDFINVSGNGLAISDETAAATTITFTGTVPERRFDTANGGESFTFTLSENADQDELDLDFDDADYTGQLATTATAEWTDFELDDEVDGSDDQAAMTDYGILISMDDPEDASDPNTLTFEVPEEQRLAQVFVTLGSVESVEGGSGLSQRVNPIAVGLAVLDRDAPAVGSENLIVVGGPCANTVAAALLGNPENCAEGFEPGKAVIRAWDKGSTVAVLVAGYEATETLGASRVLAEYEDYGLSGSEVEVVVADLNSIRVQAPSAMMDDSTDDEEA